LPDITNYKFASEGFTICTHTTSLTFDLTSDQEQLPPPPKKNLSRGKKVKKPPGEQQRRIPLQDGQNNRCHVTRWTALQNYMNTFNEYDRVYE